MKHHSAFNEIATRDRPDTQEVTGRSKIYMDYNGSAPMSAEVAAVMAPLLASGQGNPSSGHWAAEQAVDALRDARTQVAALIGATPDDIVFTSGGTEANNMAIKGIVPLRQIAGAHFISSAIEHDAVLQPLRFLKSLGARITFVPVDRFGIVAPDSVARAIRPETRLISIMHANNEIGTIQPIGEVAAIGRAHSIPVHTDAAQSAGKLAIDVQSLGVDMMSLAAHKIGGPKGIGALYIRKGLQLTPHLHGGGHEGGRRAGTENAMLAAGRGDARIFLTNDAINLAVKGKSDGLHAEGYAPVKDLIGGFVEKGGVIWVCKACADAKGLTQDDLIDGAELGGAGHTMAFLDAGGQVLL
jgi:cysteine desulfurase